MSSVAIGIIGCGVISDAYLKAASQFPVIRIVACADINPDAASQKASEYGIKALTVDAILADPDIDIILNLTTPQFHVEVGVKCLLAGKHVYSEKPLAINLEEASQLVNLAKEKNLRVGCAPDTFLGGAHQTARKILDRGQIGEVVAGTAFLMLPGHEAWHPNPDFYYQIGGGPLFDMGPYYLTSLINMIGPISSVTAMSKRSYDKRTIHSGARKGDEFTVDVDTHISAILRFKNNAIVTLTTSFDVQKHAHSPIELYGTSGSMLVSDPNKFDGVIQISDHNGDWQDVEQSHIYGDGDYRILGLADMAQGILSDRVHRASLELSLHVLETMEAIMTSAAQKQEIMTKYQCDKPLALPDNLSFGQLD